MEVICWPPIEIIPSAIRPLTRTASTHQLVTATDAANCLFAIHLGSASRPEKEPVDFTLRDAVMSACLLYTSSYFVGLDGAVTRDRTAFGFPKIPTSGPQIEPETAVREVGHKHGLVSRSASCGRKEHQANPQRP